MREWVTDLTRKFKWDVFFSTRTKIILFHTLSVVVIVLIAALLVEYIERVSLIAVIESLNTMVTTGATETDAFDEARREIERSKLFVFGSIIVAAVVMGFIATRLALRPLHDALVLQKRFIASVAHELRTPLAVLKTQNEVAKLDVDPHLSVTRTLDANIEEIDQLTEILNSLLLFNRVDTLESVTFDIVDPTAIVRHTTRRLETLAARKRIILKHDAQAVPNVYGNATALEQALFNIIKNAINYTERGGTVHISCTESDGNGVLFTIADTGIGIPQDDLPHIFEPFYRAEKRGSNVRGTGLGLALVFEIVKLHSGKIHVESSEGEGTRFELTIPRQPSLPLTGGVFLEGGVSYDFSTHKDV